MTINLNDILNKPKEGVRTVYKKSKSFISDSAIPFVKETVTKIEDFADKEKPKIIETYEEFKPKIKKTMYKFNPMIAFQQQGGTAAQQQQLQSGEDVQKQLIQLVQAAAQGNKKAQETIQQIMQAAEQGDEQAQQLAQMIQQIMQAMQQQQAQSARFGAKLNYIHKLRTGVNLDEDILYEKCGGKVTKKVVKKENCGGKCTTRAKFEKKVKTYFE